MDKDRSNDRKSHHRDETKDRERDKERAHDRHRDRGHDRDGEKDRDRRHGKDRERSEHHRNDDDERDHRHRHHRRDETKEERRERKRAKRDEKEKKKSHRRDDLEVVDDDEDGDMWVEKDLDAADAVSYIPTADSLPLHSNVSNPKAPLPSSTATVSSSSERQSWMIEPDNDPLSFHRSGSATSFSRDEEKGRDGGAGGDDFFSSLGTEHKRKERELKPDPAKPQFDRRELNTQLIEGKSLDEYKVEEEKKFVPGGPGYQWRMMKLRRLYEQAEEQNRPVEEIAMERYGSMDEFQQAIDERRFIDDRDARRKNRRNAGSDAGYSSQASSGVRTPDTSARRFVFNDDSASRPGSRGGFRRPGEEQGFITPAPATGPAGSSRVVALKRQESSSRPSYVPPQQVSTPIPSVFTPQNLTRASSEYPFASDDNEAGGNGGSSATPALTTEQLNRLQARVLRAKLADDPEATKLEEQYERERVKSERAAASGSGGGGGGGGGVESGVVVRKNEDGEAVEYRVIPTLDAHGRLYDVGLGKDDEIRPGNRRKKDPKFETRDREGNLLRYNADDDEITLGEMVRQEKFGGGSMDQKNLDAEFASQIAKDGKFDNDLDYIDDNADRLARKRMKTDAMKRQFAINDYARTKKALDSCQFCYQDERPPRTAIVAIGRLTYLCCTQTEELVPGHCLIAPIQHHLSTLEMEDDAWDEVRNFMKCLMRMYHAEGKGVIFFETIPSFKQQRHTYIECIPVPYGIFEDLPAYFRESILSSELEWTQHQKLIDFSKRPGGFRRMMVSKLPYFMVQWDYKGEKGYGHIIEGVGDAPGRGQGEDDMGAPMDEGDRGGGEFPKYFAAQVIGSILDLEPRKWMRPKRIDSSLNKERARELGTKFQPYNWTLEL